MARQRTHTAKKQQGGRPRRGQPRKATSEYFMQPGRRGAVIVLRKPCGNRVTAKECGTMPTRNHAKALIDYLERAESAVNDLFYEATDDGIEALEAILLACCEAVMKKMPVRDHRGSAAPTRAAAPDDTAATG